MDEDPYKSPLGRDEAKPPLPLWRRVVSLPLLIFGGCYIFALPDAIFETINNHEFTLKALVMTIVFAVGAGMFWSGLKIRRIV